MASVGSRTNLQTYALRAALQSPERDNGGKWIASAIVSLLEPLQQEMGGTHPPGNVPVVLLKRDIDEILLERMANNLFFKIDEGELAELRALLPPMVAGGI